MIYIDPPYNTGNDFIYPDNYSESLQTYLEYTGQIDAEGRKFSTNTEADGRFHSKWLNMMYPRLYLARNLLREDGIIFITIDDGEQDNLKKICNEIFGEDNFVAQIVWQKKQSPQNDATNFSDMHDYVLAYAKRCRHGKNETSGWVHNLLPRTESQDARYSNPDNDPRGAWTSTDYTCNKTSGRATQSVLSDHKSHHWRGGMGQSRGFGGLNAVLQKLISARKGSGGGLTEKQCPAQRTSCPKCRAESFPLLGGREKKLATTKSQAGRS